MLKANPISQNLTIKKASAKDAEQLFNLHQATFFDSVFNIINPDELPGSVVWEKEKITNKKNLYLIAQQDNQIIGRLFFERGEYKSNSHSGKMEIFVRKEFQGLGVGQILLDNLILWSSKNNVKRIELEVIKNNHPAIKFYQKNGFKIEGQKKLAYHLSGKTFDSLMMAKLI